MNYRLLNRLSILLLVALSVVGLAQQPSASTPSADRIRQVIEYLASDALEGRRTGTPGANDAAHYIMGEFNRYGLRPGMQSARPALTRGENLASYLQPFPYTTETTRKHRVFTEKPYSPTASFKPLTKYTFRCADRRRLAVIRERRSLTTGTVV